MNPFARVVVTASTLFVSAVPLAVLAADGPPPAEVDLGAMKLKRASAPATTAAATPATTAAPTGLPAVQRTNILPAGAKQSTPAAAPAAAAAAAQAPTNATAQTGIGNVVQTPLKNRATDILQTNNKPEEKTAQGNNDLQVKMPSLFRKP